MPSIIFDEYDDLKNDFYSTVAMRALKPFDFQQIWNYVSSTPRINLPMKFDNIAVLKKVDEKWVVDRVWELPIV